MEIDCSELTVGEQIALAGAITESLGGTAIALPKGRKIVIDEISGSAPEDKTVEAAIAGYIARRKDSALYSLERHYDTVVMHFPDPISASHSGRGERLPRTS